jgi:hypothetical protein
LTSLEGCAKQLAAGLVIAATQTATLPHRVRPAGFREPAARAIAAELSIRANNAIVVINFRIMGVPGWDPSHHHGEGKLDHKMRQASRFV